MSNETELWLNQNVLAGFTDDRGNPWHNRDDIMMLDGFTNLYPGAIPADDILSRLFHWKAVESPLYVSTDFGMMPVDGKKALIRSDNGYVLGIHGEGYKGHDYSEWLVDNLSRLVDGNAQYANAGLLKNGAVAWVQIETPDNIVTSGGVTFRPSILAMTSFDGSLATGIKPVITNVVCDNTMAAARSESGPAYKLKHTRNSRFILADARAAIDMIEATAESVAAEIETLTNIEVSDKQWSEFVTAHIPVADNAGKATITRADNMRAAMTGMWRTDIRVAPWNGTAWGVMQAVNTYNEHMATIRGNAERFERKMIRAINGEMETADREAMQTLSRVIGRELISA